MEASGITFDGVGWFDGEGTLAEGGRANVYGESFECIGSGILAVNSVLFFFRSNTLIREMAHSTDKER